MSASYTTGNTMTTMFHNRSAAPYTWSELMQTHCHQTMKTNYVSGEKRHRDEKNHQQKSYIDGCATGQSNEFIHLSTPAAEQESLLYSTTKRRKIGNVVIPPGIGRSIPLKKASWWRSEGLSRTLLQGSSSRAPSTTSVPAMMQTDQAKKTVPACVSSESLTQPNRLSFYSAQQGAFAGGHTSSAMRNAIMSAGPNTLSSTLSQDISNTLLLLRQASGMQQAQQEAPLTCYLKTKKALQHKKTSSILTTLFQDNVAKASKLDPDVQDYQHRLVVDDDDECSNEEGSEQGESGDDGNGELSFRAYQAENWTEKFEELLEFRAQHGHCNVPNSFPENMALAQWVKRQRYQYKLKLEKKRSTMSDERVQALEEVGFVWDSHRAIWDERFQELVDYKTVNGHCNVPSRYTANRQLAIWVKRQRRQYKFYVEKRPSSMTLERIHRLEMIDFEWDLRRRNEDEQHERNQRS